MKVVHLCLSCFYIEGFGYQENVLPRYHRRMGHDVTIVASRFSYSSRTGEPEDAPAGEYVNGDGIPVIRVNYRFGALGPLARKIKAYPSIQQLLTHLSPQVIFMHGVQFLSILDVLAFVRKHPKVRLLADTHASYDNSASNWWSMNLLHRGLYRYGLRKALPWISRFFAVTPACAHFASEVYGIDPSRIEVLPLGADTAAIRFEDRAAIRAKVRQKIAVPSNAFVLITGGKINRGKRLDTLLSLMERITNPTVFLVVFGTLTDEVRDKLSTRIEQHPRIRFVGWLDPDSIYDYYLASDLATFPGSKSALWEQAICCGLPLVCQRWQGMDYVDVGGNCIFLHPDDLQHWTDCVDGLVNDRSRCEQMSRVARSKGFDAFSYERIALESLRNRPVALEEK